MEADANSGEWANNLNIKNLNFLRIKYLNPYRLAVPAHFDTVARRLSSPNQQVSNFTTR